MLLHASFKWIAIVLLVATVLFGVKAAFEWSMNDYMNQLNSQGSTR